MTDDNKKVKLLFQEYGINILTVLGRYYLIYHTSFIRLGIWEIEKEEAEQAKSDPAALTALIRKLRYNCPEKQGIDLAFVGYGIEILREMKQWFIVCPVRMLKSDDYRLKITEAEAESAMLSRENAYNLISERLKHQFPNSNTKDRFIDLKIGDHMSAGLMDGQYTRMELVGLGYRDIYYRITEKEFDEFIVFQWQNTSLEHLERLILGNI